MNKIERTILLIDDDSSFREIVGMKLKKGGFHVEEAENGEDGIKKAKKVKPDLILLDVKMPKMTGVQVLARMKADPETASLKVIFLTNLGEHENSDSWIDEKFAKDAGALGHIKKTDELDKVLDRVKEVLPE